MYWKTAILDCFRLCVAAGALILCCTAVSGAQNPVEDSLQIRQKYYRVLGGDSVKVEYVLPKTRKRSPAVILLADRYGIREWTRRLLQVLANHEYYAVAIPLKSFVDAEPYEDTEAAIDDTDIERVIQIAVDIRNEDACMDMVALYGFDTGADIGLEAAARVPVFDACFVFYPSGKDRLQNVLDKIHVPVSVNLGAKDRRFTDDDKRAWEQRYAARPVSIAFNYYKGVGRFFYNASHPGYRFNIVEEGLRKAMYFFLTTLQRN